MIKKIFCCIALIYSTTLIAEEKEFPQLIDFSILNPYEIPGYETFDFETTDGLFPFNGALEFCPFFSYLKNTYGIDTAIETGTWMGNTAAYLGRLFPEVFTMEVNVEAFEKSRVNLQEYTNITLCYGNSPDILRQILPGLQGKRALFYLDAHWYSDWPLLEELTEISKTHRDNCIIVIDDFKVPGRPDIPYDAYDCYHMCSYEYICRDLDKVYSDYKCYYLIPKNVMSRAKFVAIPIHWDSEI